jgi:hypothetical protein
LSEDKLVKLSKDIEKIKRRLGIVECRLDYIESTRLKTSSQTKSRGNKSTKKDGKTQKAISIV